MKLNKKEPKIIREGKILVNSLGWELVLALFSIFISGLKNKSLYFQKKLNFASKNILNCAGGIKIISEGFVNRQKSKKKCFKDKRFAEKLKYIHSI